MLFLSQEELLIKCFRRYYWIKKFSNSKKYLFLNRRVSYCMQFFMYVIHMKYIMDHVSEVCGVFFISNMICIRSVHFRNSFFFIQKCQIHTRNSKYYFLLKFRKKVSWLHKVKILILECPVWIRCEFRCHFLNKEVYPEIDA